MAFLGRWARAAGRWAEAIKDVSPATKEIVMAFNEARDVERGWRAWSDAEHGGKSKASLTWVPRLEGSEDGDEGAMVLEGACFFLYFFCPSPAPSSNEWRNEWALL